MKLGIQKRQWIILFSALTLPLIINATAIQQEIETQGFLQFLSGTYQPSNPNLPLASLSEILLPSSLSILFLGFLIWLVFLVSNQLFFQKQHLVAKLIETLLIALLIAKTFEIVSGMIMPLAWLPQFNDYLLGLPISSFAINWSRWFIFPATAIILFIALMLSQNKSLESKNISKTINAFEQKRG